MEEKGEHYIMAFSLFLRRQYNGLLFLLFLCAHLYNKLFFFLEPAFLLSLEFAFASVPSPAA